MSGTQYPDSFFFAVQNRYSVKNCWEKQQKLSNLWQKRYFKNELKHSKRFDYVTDPMSHFWSWKKYQVEHYFPANFLFRVIKATGDVITLYVTREDIVWQMLFCCGPTVFYVQNCQSYKAF